MDMLGALFKRVRTRHRPTPRKRQGDTEGGYRTWEARHCGHGDRRSAWWGRTAVPGPWSLEAEHATPRGGHAIWATVRRHKLWLGLAALALLLTAGVAVGVVLLVVILGLQVMGLLGQVDVAGLIETARVMLLEVLGGVLDVSGLREGQT
ncbi:MAG: hypothetical protein H6Q86_2970 [candidate division NC10 bacterium]|nr:hypothetical protein [candidate division NC10 bacterium]